MENPGIREALTIEKAFWQSKKERRLSELREKAMRDEVSALAGARAEGEVRGKVAMAQGKNFKQDQLPVNEWLVLLCLIVFISCTTGYGSLLGFVKGLIGNAKEEILSGKPGHSKSPDHRGSFLAQRAGAKALRIAGKSIA